MCDVSVEVFGGDVDVCGTQNSFIFCSALGGVNLFGDGFISNNGVEIYTLQTPTQLVLSPSPFSFSIGDIDVLVTTATDVRKYVVPVMGSTIITIDNNCGLN